MKGSGSKMWSSYVVTIAIGLLAIFISLGLTGLGVWLAYRPKPKLLGYTVTPSRWRISYIVWGLWPGFEPGHIPRALVALDSALRVHVPAWRDSFQRVTRSTYVQFHPAVAKYGTRKAQLGHWNGQPVIASGFQEGRILHVVFDPRDKIENTAFLHEMIHRLEEENEGHTSGAHNDPKIWEELVHLAKKNLADSGSLRK